MALSRVLSQEIARADQNPTNLLFAGEAEIEDKILRLQLGGDYRRYRSVLYDLHVNSKLEQRVQAVVGKERVIEPASDNEADLMAARLCEWYIGQVPFDDICRKLLYAVLFGRSHAEMTWNIEGVPRSLQAKGYRYSSATLPMQVNNKEQEFFKFIFPGAPGSGYRRSISSPRNLPTRSIRLPVQKVNGYELHVCTRENIMGQPAPIFKFINHSFGSLTDNPNGAGIGGMVWWYVVLKRDFLKFWLKHAEKFSMPGMVGTYPDGDTPDLLETFFGNYGRDGWAVLPEGNTVDLLEQTRQDNIKTYLEFLNWVDRQISQLITGQSYGPEVSQGLTGVPAKVDDEVRKEWVKSDADLLAPVIKKQWLEPIVKLNIPGAETPNFWWDTGDQEDLKTRSERDRNLFDMGFRLTADAVTRIYGDDYQEISSDTPASIPPVAGDDRADNPMRDDDPMQPDSGPGELPGRPGDELLGDTSEANVTIAMRAKQPGKLNLNTGLNHSLVDLVLGNVAHDHTCLICNRAVSFAETIATPITEQLAGSIDGVFEAVFAAFADRLGSGFSYSQTEILEVLAAVQGDIAAGQNAFRDSLTSVNLLAQMDVLATHSPDELENPITPEQVQQLAASGDNAAILQAAVGALGQSSVDTATALYADIGQLFQLIILDMFAWVYDFAESNLEAISDADGLRAALANSGWIAVDGNPVATRANLHSEANTNNARQAGRLGSMAQIIAAYPFWQWRHNTVDEQTRRPDHFAIDGMVLPADAEFWQLYFPPLGNGCRCDVVPLAEMPDDALAIDPPWIVTDLDGVPVLALEVEDEKTGRRLVPIAQNASWLGQPNTPESIQNTITAISERIPSWLIDTV